MEQPFNICTTNLGTFDATIVVNSVIHGLFCDAVYPGDPTIQATVAVSIHL